MSAKSRKLKAQGYVTVFALHASGWEETSFHGVYSNLELAKEAAEHVLYTPSRFTQTITEVTVDQQQSTANSLSRSWNNTTHQWDSWKNTRIWW